MDGSIDASVFEGIVANDGVPELFPEGAVIQNFAFYQGRVVGGWWSSTQEGFRQSRLLLFDLPIEPGEDWSLDFQRSYNYSVWAYSSVVANSPPESNLPLDRAFWLPMLGVANAPCTFIHFSTEQVRINNETLSRTITVNGIPSHFSGVLDEPLDPRLGMNINFENRYAHYETEAPLLMPAFEETRTYGSKTLWRQEILDVVKGILR